MDRIEYSDLQLEQYLLGELHKDDVIRIEKDIEKSSQLNKRLEKIKIHEKDFHKQFTTAEIVDDIMKKDKNEKDIITRTSNKISQRFSMPRILIPSLVTAALVIILLIPMFQNKTGQLSNLKKDVLRVKGNNSIINRDPEIFLYRKKNIKNVEQLKQDDLAKKGDLIQIAYMARKKKYGIIISMDGNSVLTLHYPAKSNDSCELEQGRKVYLKHSYELDNAPDFEQFWFITSMENIDVEGMIKMIEKEKNRIMKNNNNKVTLSDRYGQRSILIRKGVKR